MAANECKQAEDSFPATSFLCPSERDIVLATFVTSVVL
jgi:hypothetical protein